MTMRRLTTIVYLLMLCSLSFSPAVAQQIISLAGAWDFAIERDSVPMTRLQSPETSPTADDSEAMPVLQYDDYVMADQR